MNQPISLWMSYNCHIILNHASLVCASHSDFQSFYVARIMMFGTPVVDSVQHYPLPVVVAKALGKDSTLEQFAVIHSPDLKHLRDKNGSCQ